MNIMKRIIRKLYQMIIKPLNLVKMKRLGIQFFPPNYVFFDSFNEHSVIVDVGCGHEAEFSKYMIERYNLNAFGVDPTRKHSPALKQLEGSTAGKFRHLAIAVAERDGVVTFNESRQNESGSILSDHTNVRNDDLITYDVESVSMSGLVRKVGATHVDLLKLDLEGAEYGLLEKITEEDLSPFNQIFIEFHDHCTDHTIQETEMLVQRICSKGFDVFTLDAHNYLFYKE
jgi:FkbM family methyltransferase